ncbi:MAG: hypothetical protein PWQ88_1234 [Candidatus Methanomethylophilaceae archaeon]|nr:hypothetical protein [Candidatus Methanomethylophilaceae archaeon]MDI3541311.1 hypothetical protein [Candidatus Methanomethylophilaceae archaeon]HIJ00903.1 DUF3198 domain-containing protein [Candidatus Methanomethylophilaceae archaeon]
MSKPFRVENADILWPGMTILGLAITLISLRDILAMESSLIGGWSFYSFLIGVIFLIWGAWELATYIKRIRKFRVLLNETSKARVIRNLEEMEYLAWCLPSRYGEALEEKKRSLHIK